MWPRRFRQWWMQLWYRIPGDNNARLTFSWLITGVLFMLATAVFLITGWGPSYWEYGGGLSEFQKEWQRYEIFSRTGKFPAADPSVDLHGSLWYAWQGTASWARWISVVALLVSLLISLVYTPIAWREEATEGWHNFMERRRDDIAQLGPVLRRLLGGGRIQAAAQPAGAPGTTATGAPPVVTRRFFLFWELIADLIAEVFGRRFFGGR